jgi:hypothetical protein
MNVSEVLTINNELFLFTLKSILEMKGCDTHLSVIYCYLRDESRRLYALNGIWLRVTKQRVTRLVPSIVYQTSKLPAKNSENI